VESGLGPFYDGVGHLVLTPEDLIATLAVALLAGLRGREHGRWALLALPAAWLAGGAIVLVAAANRVSTAASTAESTSVAGVLSLLLLGALVAADVRWPRRATAALAVVVGLVHGGLDGASMAAAGGGWPTLAGTVTGVFVLVTVAAASLARVQAPWSRIALRVAGSWIAAIGLLMLGWSLRGSPR
jgi:hydrogenase/urease accessory protein HupE